MKKNECQPVELSDKCSTYEIDMKTKVECPACGKMIAFGDGYASGQYHTDLGFGYTVCSKCYGKELQEALKRLKELQK